MEEEHSEHAFECANPLLQTLFFQKKFSCLIVVFHLNMACKTVLNVISNDFCKLPFSILILKGRQNTLQTMG